MITVLKTLPDKTTRELSLSPLEPGTWINLVAPSQEEIEEVSLAAGVPLDFLLPALDPEEASRIEADDEDGNILVVINVPKMEGNYRFDVLPLGVIITRGHLITVALEKNDILPSDPSAMGGVSTYKRTRFLFQILFRTATLYLKYLGQIDRRSNDIEGNLRKSMKNEELFQLLDLEKSLTYFTTALRSNRSVVDKLIRICANSQMHEIIKVREEDEELLEDVKVEYDQAYEMVQMYSNILSGMMDAFASIISNNLNMVMKFLASVTIILAIPTVVASFWGMNVFVPFAGRPLGFWAVSGISALFTGAAAFLLWKKHML
ncbi:MAG: magnesium transporter CorA family protein [Synergistaceae bacterium]|nr:magnesium transporter CorA family protein [Synergistaceae bacterium]